MRFIYPSILFFFLVNIPGVYAQPFLKHYSSITAGESVMDAAVVPGEGYAFLTNAQLVFVDANGTVLRQWNPAEPADIMFTKLGRTTSGKLIVLGVKQDNRSLFLYLVRQDGTTGAKIELLQPAGIYYPQVREGAGGNFYITYHSWPAEGRKLQVHCMNDNGVELWKRELPGTLSYRYGVDNTATGGLVVTYIDRTDGILKLSVFTAAGDLTTRDVTTVTNQNEIQVPEFCAALPDGGYLIGGTEDLWNTPGNADMLLIRTDGEGKLMNKFLVDGKMMDALIDLQVDGDAIYLLSESGKKGSGVESQTGNDLLLSHIRIDGSLVWKKAFGNGAYEMHSARLLINTNQLLIAANGTSDGKTGSVVLIQTGQDGNAMDNQLPDPFQSFKNLTHIKLLQDAGTEELISSAPTADGGYVSSGRLILQGEDDYTACVFRTDAQGRTQWVTLLSEEVSRPGHIKTTPDGNFILVLTEFFGQNKVGYVIKIDGTGKLLWKKKMDFLFPEDVVAPPDGGYLVIGAYPKRQELTITMRRLSAQGDLVWSKDYHENGRNTEGRFIALTADQQVAVAGTVQVPGNIHTGIYFMKTDLNGTRIKDFDLFKRDSLLQPQCLLALSNNEVLIGGSAHTMGTVHRDAMLVKADASGQLQWANHYHISHRDEGYVLQQAREQILFAGITNDPVFGTRKNAGFIVVLDKDGIIGKKYFFGDQLSETHIRSMFLGAGNKVHITGTRYDQYHVPVPFMAGFEPEIVLSARDPEKENQVTVYPNPARTRVFLTVKNQYAGNVGITVSGMNGIRRKTMQVRKSAGVATFDVPLEGLPAGIYQVELFFANEKIVKSLMILPD